MTIHIHHPPDAPALLLHDAHDLLLRIETEARQVREAIACALRQSPLPPEFDAAVCPFDDTPPAGKSTCAVCEGWFLDVMSDGRRMCNACRERAELDATLDAYLLASESGTPGVIALRAAPEVMLGVRAANQTEGR